MNIPNFAAEEQCYFQDKLITLCPLNECCSALTIDIEVKGNYYNETVCMNDVIDIKKLLK